MPSVRTADLPVSAREVRLRALDRERIGHARFSGRRLRLFWLLLGPGLLVMLGENDGPSMVSYAATGAAYGIGFFLPFILLTFAMAYAVQEMAARVGIASGRGHAALIFERFGRFWGGFALIDLLLGNLLTLVAEFAAILAGASFFGIAAPRAALLASGLILAALALRRYARWERALMALAMGNLLFVPAALLAHPAPAAIAHALLFWQPGPARPNGAFLTLILANIGATVTPWMIFFQQSAVIDKGLTRADLPGSRADTALGAAIAAGAAIACLLAASALHRAGIDPSRFTDGADYAGGLRPLLGHTGAALFALGLIEAGLVAAMTISTTSSYALAEAVRAGTSLNLDLRRGGLFYGVAVVSIVLAALLVLLPGLPLVTITLAVNGIATVLMGPALLMLMRLANARDLMGDLTNGPLANWVGGLVAAFVTLASALYAVASIFPGLFGA